MAYVNVEPTSDSAEDQMLVCAERIRELLRESILKVWEVPETDILVMLKRNTVLMQDPSALMYGVLPQLVIKINTSDIGLQPKAMLLMKNILEAWEQTFGSSYPIEVWIDFFDTWGTNIKPP
jgi:hypothetical protein